MYLLNLPISALQNNHANNYSYISVENALEINPNVKKLSNQIPTGNNVLIPNSTSQMVIENEIIICSDDNYGELIGSYTLQTTEGAGFNAYKYSDWSEEQGQSYHETNIAPIYPSLIVQDYPTFAYNCHSYAWYDQSDDNQYQIKYTSDVLQFINDVHTTPIFDESNLQKNDIVTYWEVYQDSLGNIILAECLHSALIVDIEPNGNIVCESKWGNWGRYIHDLNYVPQSYCSIFVDAYGNYVYEPFPIYFRYTQDEHFLSIDEDNGSSGHTFICTAKTEDENGNVIKSCSYTTECAGAFTVTSVNSSYHRIYCPDCYYSEYVDHDLYMYSAEPEDYVVKCRDCTYTVECWESPEYYGNSEDGHWVDCACGCYSFFEPHNPGSYINMEEGYHEIECADCGYVYTEDCNYGSAQEGNSSYHYYECTDCGYEHYEYHVFTYSQIENDNHIHSAYCRICRKSYAKLHNWVSASGGYRCTDCNMRTTILPNYSSMSNEDLELLISSLSDEELEAFLASLPEADLARVTAILPPDDDELVTE